MSDNGTRKAEGGALPGGVLRRAFIYNITCATPGCGDSNSSLDAGPVFDYREAEETFRSWGWRRRKDGWTCPDCVDPR